MEINKKVLIKFIQEQIDFLKAIKKWGSWKRMSKFAKENIDNQIRELEYSKEKVNENY